MLDGLPLRGERLTVRAAHPRVVGATPAEALALRRRVRRRGDALRRRRGASPASASSSGRCGTGRALHERTAFARRRPVAVPDGRLIVRDGDVEIDLVLVDDGEAVEVASPHGRSYIWTRKQPVRARGTVRIGGREIAVDAPGLIDDSAGYHARRTAWEWSAGAGTGAGGERVVWNLVTGVHDGAQVSERTVWVDGVAHAVGPVAFSTALDAVDDLRFTEEARRARRDELLLFASDYVQPFGTFAGTLPGGLDLREGFGVMERHTARW